MNGFRWSYFVWGMLALYLLCGISFSAVLAHGLYADSRYYLFCCIAVAILSPFFAWLWIRRSVGGKRYAVNRNVIIFVTVLLVVTSLVMALVYVMDDHMAGEVLEPIL